MHDDVAEDTRKHIVQHYVPQASAAERAGFERLICLPDPEILGLLTGRERSEDVEIRAVVGAIIAGTVR